MVFTATIIGGNCKIAADSKGSWIIEKELRPYSPMTGTDTVIITNSTSKVIVILYWIFESTVVPTKAALNKVFWSTNSAEFKVLSKIRIKMNKQKVEI